MKRGPMRWGPMRGGTSERIPLIRDGSTSTVVQPMAEYIRQQIET